MNKRLRKKKRVGEFAELGFDVEIYLRPRTTPDGVAAFVERFGAIVEARGLAFDGGAFETMVRVFVVAETGRSVSATDRAAVMVFLKADAAVLRFTASALMDARTRPTEPDYSWPGTDWPDELGVTRVGSHACGGTDVA